jgi:glycosyltransferase involved in cell wall biosynthesis
MMMKSLGHEVILYGGEDNDTPCDEFITCITKQEQGDMFNVFEPNDILKEPFVYQTYEPHMLWWDFWNKRVIEAMSSRIEKKDFLCLTGGGVLFEPLISAMPNALAVEYAIGYAGIASRTHHCYGSSNWQHVVFGLQRYQGWRGKFYDRVIPHYFDLNDFEFKAETQDYCLYLGKLKEDKGILVASKAAEVAGRDIIFAGQGPTPIPYGKVLNRYIGPDERKELLTNAAMVFIPSLYVEPFGMIAVEALISGTPIITTPWGGLGEINIDKLTGFHCNNFKDFVNAVIDIKRIDPTVCNIRGKRYDMEFIKYEYQRWFNDLYGLWDGGWDTL